MYTVILVAITVVMYQRDEHTEHRQLRRIESLIAAGREQELYPFLADDDPDAVHLATQGLWECWLNEKGPAARHVLELGVQAMNAGNFAGADRIFTRLTREYPDWAEALNKQATLLYLRQQPAASLAICQRVVRLKPNHFGAWAGLAMCAMRLEDWSLARHACREAMRIQPHSIEHQRVLSVIELHIPALDV